MVITILVAISAWILVWSIQVGRHADDPNLIASLCSLFVSIATVGVTWPGFLQPRLQLTPELLASELERLASMVRRNESEQRAEQLGDDTVTINLSFTLIPGTVRPVSGAAKQGKLANVYEYYRNLSIQRFVITGAGGSGKTMLAMELLLRMIKERSEGDPLPVRFALANWDANVDVGEWMAQQIRAVYGVAHEIAEELVNRGLIIPVFDGLDEMTPDPENLGRAVAAVTAVNRIRLSTESGPMVVTCRREALEQLADKAGISVLDAAIVAVEQLHADEIIDYVRRRFTDQQRWQEIVRTLERYPTGQLAQGLSTPWRLTMAVTAYADMNSEAPTVLLAETTEEGIRQLLLAHYVHVTSRSHSNSTGRPYKSANVVRWLSRLAKHLEASNGRTVQGHALSGTDLTIHEIWPIGGLKLPVVVDAVLNALCITLGSAILTGILAINVPWWVFIVSGIVICYFLTTEMSETASWPTVITSTWRQSWSKLGSTFSWTIIFGVTVLTFAVALFLEAGLHTYPATLGISNHRLDHIATTLVGSAIVGALALRFGAEIKAGDNRIVDPNLPLRRDMWQSSTVLIPVIFLAALTVRIPNFPLDARSLSNDLKAWLQYRPPRSGHGVTVLKWSIRVIDNDITPWLTRHFPAGWPHRWPQMVELGIVSGILVAFEFMRAQRRYIATLIVMAGRLPFRLGRFMTWAHSAGLLRKAGASFQFRHKELQEWLAQQ